MSSGPFGACGKGGIRTLGTVSRTPLFESGAFDLSATFPVQGIVPIFDFFAKIGYYFGT